MFEESGIITIFRGEDISAEKMAELEESVTAKYGKHDIMCHNGGQPLYYYIISVE